MREEADARRIEREEARLKREENERRADERRFMHENNQTLIQLAMVKAFTGFSLPPSYIYDLSLPILGNKDIGVTETPVEPPKKTIKVCQAASEDDSEGFPVLLIVENIKNLVLNLLELLQLQNSENKPVVKNNQN